MTPSASVTCEAERVQPHLLEASGRVGAGPHAALTYKQALDLCSPYCRRLVREASPPGASLRAFRTWCITALPRRAAEQAPQRTVRERLLRHRVDPPPSLAGRRPGASASWDTLVVDMWSCIVQALPELSDYMALLAVSHAIRSALLPLRVARCAAYAFGPKGNERIVASACALLHIPPVVRIADASEMLRVAHTVDAHVLRRVGTLAAELEEARARLRAAWADWNVAAQVIALWPEERIVMRLREVRAAHAAHAAACVRLRALTRRHALRTLHDATGAL